MKSITILGAGESGFGAAMLAHLKGFNVFVSDSNKINEERKGKTRVINLKEVKK
jgi:UDP-N-acetylmuramoylalanine--D-glutamate ligase